jgi:uncharacterized protein (TIGR01777 family)
VESHNSQRIIVTGATGQIGSALCARLLDRGDAPVVFSRDPEAARRNVPGAAEYVAWHPQETGSWAARVASAHAVVYLAGGSLYGGPQSEADVRAEVQHRALGIRGIVRAMAGAAHGPRILIAASSVGIYGYAGFGDDPVAESSPPATDFWGQVSREWEQPALDAAALGIRAVVARIGYVLDARPGTGFARQLAQFRAGYGGPVQPGTQWMPWIHIADTVGLLLLALDDARAHGPLNGAAPGIVRNQQFAAALGAILDRPAGRPMPAEMLRARLGVMADTIVHGRRVVPERALALGYQFRFPALDAALRDLVSQDSTAVGWGTTPY